MDSLIPLMLTVQHGYGATLAGLPLAAGGVAWTVVSWLQSRPPRGDDEEHRLRLVRFGFGITALSTLAAAAAASPSVSGWWALVASCLANVGAGLTLTTVNVLVLRRTTEEERGFNAAATQLAGAAGTAVLTGLGGVLVAAAARGAIGFDTAFLTVNLTMTLVLALGMVLTGRLRSGAGAAVAEPLSAVDRSGSAWLCPAGEEASP
jgi:MFS family permease